MVNFSESFLKFLEEEALKGHAVARLITQAIRLQRYYPVYRILTTEEVDYITMRADGMLSYLPAGKEHKTNERGEWAREGRQTGKPAKVIRKIFRERALRFIAAKEFESFGNAYKAKFLDNGFEFVIRPHKEIPDVYDMSRSEGEGSLNNSCMNGDTHYMDIYKNCESLRILTLVNSKGYLCGRALVWNVNHRTHGDIVFMDRIYVNEEYMYELFLNYAREQKWWRKNSYRSYENKATWINPETDKAEHMDITVYLKTDWKRYPYIDTFTYGGNGYLNNCSSDLYTYTETGGSRQYEEDDEYNEDNHDGETHDEINDEWISDDDAVYVEYGDREYRGKWTHRDNCIHVLTGRRIRHWYHEDDSNIVEITNNNSISDWYTKDHDDVVYTHDGEHRLCDECWYCETDGDHYDADDERLMQAKDGSYYHKENDDDVIYVEGLNGAEGDYVYKPDHGENDFCYGYHGDWFWATDKRYRRVEVTHHDHSEYFMCKKDDLIKVGRRYYHMNDTRLVSLLSVPNNKKRKAYQA